MKTNQIIPFLVFLIFLSSCFTSRKGYYEFNDANKKIILNTFRYGKVSNGDNIVDTIISKPKKYKIKGKENWFYWMNVTVKSKHKGKTMVVKVKATTLYIPIRDVETFFLDEVSKDLFEANYREFDEKVKKIKKEKKK